MKFMRHMDANDESFRVDAATRQLPWYQKCFPKITLKRVLKFTGVFLYLILGCVFYKSMEGWYPFETLFFTVVTISTVGYGYDHATNDKTRLFTIFYAVLGIYVIYFYIGKEISKSFSVGMRYIKTLSSVDEVGASMDKQKKMILSLILVMVIFILLSGGVFVALEPEWSYIESIYFAVQTTTTVGYGDIRRPNTRTKIFLVFYIIFSTLLSAFIYNSIQLLQAEKKQIRKLQEKLKKRQDMNFLGALDRGDGVNESDFILAVLQHIGTLNLERDIVPWKKKFQEMDSGNGRVFHDSLMEFSTRESVYAKEAAAMIGNIESTTMFEALTKTDKATNGMKITSQRKEMELKDIKSPMNHDDNL